MKLVTSISSGKNMYGFYTIFLDTSSKYVTLISLSIHSSNKNVTIFLGDDSNPDRVETLSIDISEASLPSDEFYTDVVWSNKDQISITLVPLEFTMPKKDLI